MTDPTLPIPPAPGKVTETTTTITKVEAPNRFSRKVEDAGLLLCLVLFGLWMLTAVLRGQGYILGPCQNLHAPGFPWEFVVSGGTFALPKIIGRATAGRVWERLAGRGGTPPEGGP